MYALKSREQLSDVAHGNPLCQIIVRNDVFYQLPVWDPGRGVGWRGERGRTDICAWCVMYYHSSHRKSCESCGNGIGTNSQFSDNDEIPSPLKGFMECQNVRGFSCHLEQNFHLSPYLRLLPGPQSNILCCQFCASLFSDTLMHDAKPTSEEGGGERRGEGEGERERGRNRE